MKAQNMRNKKMKRNKRKKGRRFLKIGFDFRYKTFIITYESLAKIFYPNKKARKNRVAFMMIYIALRENWRDDTTTAKLEEIRRERAPEWPVRSAGYIFSLSHKALSEVGKPRGCFDWK